MDPRPGPPVTVVVPGSAGRAADVLTAGPPAPRRPPLPRGQRWTAAAAAVVLLGGLVTVARAGAAPPSPQPAPARLPAPVAVPGVAASLTPVGPVRQPGELVARFALAVTVEAIAPRGDSGSPSARDAVVLQALTARGFVVDLVGADLPLEVAGSRQRTQMGFEVEVRVTDCSVDTQAPRQLALDVSRSDARGTLRVLTSADVVAVLDRLVSRSCRRPRG